MTEQANPLHEPTDQGPSRGDRVRQAAVSSVLAIYRLLKASLLHSENNATIVALIQQTTDAIHDYCSLTGATRVRILFASSTVFVNGSLLRANQSSYESAIDLGAMLDKCGVSEVTIPDSVTLADLSLLTRNVAEALRGSASPLGEKPSGSITLRKVVLASFDAPTRPQSTRERVLRTYSAAIVVMRSFFDDLRGGNHHLPNRIKRVAQKLVSHGEESLHAVTAMLGARPHDTDAGALAVNAAILALAMAKQVTSDRHVLVAIVTTTLLYDTARVRVLASGEQQVLTDDQLDRLPASSTVMLTSLGRLHVPALQRAVVAYEAHWMARTHRLGPVYASLHTPLLASRILATARAFTEMTASCPGRPDLSIDDAIQVILERARTPDDRIDGKLLTGALGIFPVGTLVELDTGETAVVTAPPILPGFFARPPVRILYDKDMRVVDPPMDVDLAASARTGQPLRRIRRTIDTDDQQMKQMRSFLVAAQAGVARKVPREQAPATQRVAPIREASRGAPDRAETDPKKGVKKVIEQRTVPKPPPAMKEAARPAKIDNLLAEFLADDVPESAREPESSSEPESARGAKSGRKPEQVEDEPPASSRRDPRTS